MRSEWNTSVSIVVPNLNGRELLAHCLQAIAKLDYPQDLLEVIVVDNASVDGSTYFLSREHPQVKVIASDFNVGFAQAINLGAEAASGQYLFILNNDAAPDPSCIKELLGPLVAHQCECTTAQIINQDRSTVHYAGGGMNFHGIAYQDYEGTPYQAAKPSASSQPMLFPCGAAMMIEASLYQKVGGMDRDFFAYFEDVDFGWRLWIMGYRTHFVPSATVTHKQSSTSRFIWLPKLRVLHIRNPLMMIYKNYDQAFLDAVLPAALMLTAQRSRRLSQWPEDYFKIDAETHLASTQTNEPFDLLQTVSLPALAASDFVALNNWADQFESLTHKRKSIQSQRVLSDTEIISLFKEPFRYAEADTKYHRLQDTLCESFGINQLFAQAVSR